MNLENDYIKKINQSFKEFEIYLKTIENETGYYLTFPIARRTCEQMLRLLLHLENRQIKEDMPYLKFITKYKEKSLIPKECEEMLRTIGTSTNRYIHGEIPTYQTTFTFLNSFNYFIKWFDDKFKEYGIENQFKISTCCEIIESLPTPTKGNYNAKPESFSESHLSKHENHFQSKGDEIENICKLISSFEKQLTFDLKLSSSLIVTASAICELILKFILKKEGYKDKYRFYDMIRTCYENRVIPNECYKFLIIILRYRNIAIHSVEPSDEFILNFLEAFNLFLIWFNEYCSVEDVQSVKKIIKIEEKDSREIENLRNELKIKDSLYKDEKIKNEKLFEENKKLEKEKRIQQQEHYKKFDIIINKLNIGLDKMDKSIEIQQETNENTVRIESKIDEIHQILLLIKDDIVSIQSETSKMLENAQNEEKEAIFEQHMNRCKDNIISQMQTINETKMYESEQQKLKRIFEDSAWNKLSDKSKTFLTTSKLMFKQFNNMGNIIDYSGICILVTKALEVEIKKRFFTNFLKYLDKNYNKDYSKYPTPLLYKNKKPLFSDTFTMGSVAYVLCYKKSYSDSVKQEISNKEKLMEYCKSCVFSTLSENEIENLLHDYAVSIEKIKKNYRDRSAHTGELEISDARQCLDLMIDIEKLLKKMLDSFDI